MNQMQQKPMAKMPKETLAAILRSAGGTKDLDEAAEALRALGAASAEGLVAGMRERLAGIEPAELSADRFWSELGGFLEELGWGSVQQESLHPGVLSIASPDWFESVGGRSDHPACHFTTGALAELLRVISDAEIAAMEVECRSCGDEHCRFLVGSPVALDDVYEDLVQGATVPDAVASLR